MFIRLYYRGNSEIEETILLPSALALILVHCCPAAEETYNVTVKNVEARAKAALSVRGEIKNLFIGNINGFDDCKTVIEKLSRRSG